MWIQMKLARYQVALFTLIMLLQRTPVIRHLVALEKAISAPMAQVIRWATVGATALGGMHTYSGASTLVSSPLDPEDTKPYEGPLNEQFGVVLSVTDTNRVARSWTFSGTLPAGLSVPNLSNGLLVAQTLSIVGTPTESGEFPIEAQPWRGTNGTGSTSDQGAFKITITILAPPVDVVVPMFIESKVPGGVLIEWDGVDGLNYSVEMASDGKTWGPDARTIDDAGSKRSFVIDEDEAAAGKIFRVKADNNPG